MLGSAKAETQLTIIEVTEHDLFLSPGVIPSHHIVLFSSRKIEWTSCTFKNLKNIFYLLERFNYVNILGMREDFRILCLIDVSIIAIHATEGGGGGVNWRQGDPFQVSITANITK